MDTALDSTAKERLISADSHVHFTDEWVKERLAPRLRPRWDEAMRKSSEWEARELRRGQPQLELEVGGNFINGHDTFTGGVPTTTSERGIVITAGYRLDF